MKLSRLFIALLAIGTLVILILVLGVPGCKRGNGADVPQNAQGTTVGSASPPLTQANSLETQLLIRSFWVAEFYVIPGENGQLYPARQNKGMWWRFNIDGTYVGGQWDQQFDAGSWFWRSSGSEYEKNGVLYIDSSLDDQRDIEFQIQGIEENGSVMSWVKTQNSASKEPGMLKMIPLMSMPTKRQFGVEE